MFLLIYMEIQLKILNGIIVYSYDAFVVIRNGKNEEIEHIAYSDRMLSWVSYDKWKKCIAKMGDKKSWNI